MSFWTLLVIIYIQVQIIYNFLLKNILYYLIRMKITGLDRDTPIIIQEGGLSINECAAHWHPSPNDNSILKKDDIIKIDFGTEANGWIIDSAFTVCFDQEQYIYKLSYIRYLIM